jgi:hypothetical protein
VSARLARVPQRLCASSVVDRRRVGLGHGASVVPVPVGSPVSATILHPGARVRHSGSVALAFVALTVDGRELDRGTDEAVASEHRKAEVLDAAAHPYGEVPGGVAVLPKDEAQRALDDARAAGRPAHELAKLHAMLAFVATEDYGAPPVEINPPCYFDTGCCSFADGDVTGLEIANGKIRLVRWLNNNDEPLEHELDAVELSQICDEVAGRTPTRSSGGDTSPVMATE